MQLPKSIGLPSFGEPTYRVVVVSSEENLAGRLNEDLRPHDLDARQYKTINQALDYIDSEDLGDASSFDLCTILVTASLDIAALPIEIRNQLSLLQQHQGLLIVTGRSSDSNARAIVCPVVINDVLPFPFDYGEVLHRLRHLLEHRAIKKQAILTEALLTCIGEALMITDKNDRILWVNEQFSLLTGYQSEEVVGKRPKFMRSSQNPPEFLDQIWNTLKDTGSWRGEIWNRRKDGGAYAEWLTVNALRGLNGATEGYLTLFTDITARKIHEEHLQHQALHDPLTALPNRLLLEDRFTLAIAQAKRTNRYVALAFLDLDGFKEANDRFGHATGDQVLILLAKRLQEVLRSSDTVSRYGGDEFVCLLNDLVSTSDATSLADKIMGAAAEPYVIDGQTLELSASIGLGVFPEDGGDFDSLQQFADSAMYQAKTQGKNRYCWH